MIGYIICIAISFTAGFLIAAVLRAGDDGE